MKIIPSNSLIRKKLWHTLPLILISLYLNGCSSLQEKPSEPLSWKEHQHNITPLNNWVLRGKLGIKSANKSGSASLYWQQSDNHYQIQLDGPFGQGKIRLQGSAKQMRLERSNQEAIETNHPETLLLKELGWTLPIEHIPFWVKGLPAPDVNIDKQQITNGTLNQLQQGGWTLQYSRYQISNEALLPGKIIMSKDHVKLTLIAKQWQTP